MSARPGWAVRVVGAGFPRTGTTSLSVALERLLGAPCFHMRVLLADPVTAPTWAAALAGDEPDWPAFLSGYAAAVDWPASCFWRAQAAAFPDALVLLSYRDSPATWFASMSRTVLHSGARLLAASAPPPFASHWTPEQFRAVQQVFARIGDGLFTRPDDRVGAIAAYERHLADVRAAIPADRLLEWQPGDGWEPLCAALGVPVPDEAFPHENTTAQAEARRAERDRAAGIG